MTVVHYDVDRIRSFFPALADGTAYFDGPGGTQVPTPVAEAVAQTLVSGIANRGTVTAAARRADEVVHDCRHALADLLGAEAGGVVFGRSATELTFHTARTLARAWEPGDEVVVTRLDHDANIRPWALAAAERGATLRMVDFDPATGDLHPDAVREQLSERTRMLAFTAASNLIGTRPEIRELADAAHEVGSLVYLDAVHHVPHVRTYLPSLGVDFLACSPYKFLGPHCGVLAAHPSLLSTLRPAKLLPSSDDVPERFELGTLPYELMAGATAAVDFLADLVPGEGTRAQRLDASFAALEEHENVLIGWLEQGLDDLGARRYGRACQRTPTILFSLPGQRAAAVAEHLAQQGINAPAGSFYALLASRHLGLGDDGAVRVGLAPYSSVEDVERLVSAVAQLA